MSVTIGFAVEGMSCGHCEKTVSAELSGVPGVTGVTADAKAGRVAVSAEHALDEELVRRAVDEAGFTLVGRV
ncbi:heavy-metal-associated domain-containing protein [Kitasatospora sp. NPDC051914]|uniref:heavy-metal-associated domain-containing protein n=1 Tax=Kitasatospora sp. NPDC051914 TaxID=3154945 RepID=UPI003436D435